MRSLWTSLTALLFLALAAASATAQQAERWKSEGWKTDFSKSNVRFPTIQSGGPPKDGIPPIDDPIFQTVSENTTYADKEPVIGLEFNGDARAYPLQVMTWHEIVNDTVGGKPVAVTFCPLCNAAIVFDATLDGEPHTFGTTGKLRNSDLIMYDRKTESWWQQFSGEAITGAYTGKLLDILPARLESWAQFKARHPDGKVLVPNNPARRDYGRNPYVGYDVAARPFLYSGPFPENISPMARVVIVRRKGAEPIIVAMQKVRDRQELMLDGYRLTWSAGQTSALNAANIAESKDVGTVVAERVDGGKAELVPYDVTFAFVAHAFHPEVAIRQ